MFYLSRMKQTESGKLFGITDSRDNVEEFYTEKHIEDIMFKKRIKLEGCVFSGSYVVGHLTTPDLIAFEDLPDGASFIVSCERINGQFIKLGTQFGGDIWNITNSVDVTCRHRAKALRREDFVRKDSLMKFSTMGIDKALESKMRDYIKKSSPSIAMRFENLWSRG